MAWNYVSVLPEGLQHTGSLRPPSRLKLCKSPPPAPPGAKKETLCRSCLSGTRVGFGVEDLPGQGQGQGLGFLDDPGKGGGSVGFR